MRDDDIERFGRGIEQNVSNFKRCKETGKIKTEMETRTNCPSG